MSRSMHNDLPSTNHSESDAAHWLTFLEDLFPDLLSSRRAIAFDRFESVYPHLHEALSWFVQRGDVARAARMVRVLREYWGARGGVAEGQSWIAQTLALPDAAAPSPERATLLDHAAMLAYYADDYPTASDLLHECLAIRRALGLAAVLPVTLSHLASVTRIADGDDTTARRLYEECLVLAREQGNTYIVRGTLYRLARLLLDHGEHQAARTALEENVSLARATGTDYALGMVLRAFAVIAAHAGQPERALRLAGAGKPHHEAGGIIFGPTEEAWFEGQLHPALQSLSASDQSAARHAGSKLTLDQALAEALAI